jgi:putative ABC transport system permease protein
MGMEVTLRGGQNLEAEPPPEGEDQVLLGVGLARALGIVPGDSVALLAATADGSLDAMDVTVRGLMTTGLHELDGRVLKTHVVTAQRLLGTSNVSALVITLDDASWTKPVQKDLLSLPGKGDEPLAVQDWETRAPFYGQVRALYSGIFFFLGTLVFVLVVLSTSNTLLMSVLERVREFGTLRAIGTSRGQIAALVVLEALWLGLLGGAIGALLGLGLTLLINAVKIKMPPPPGAADPLDLALRASPSDFALALFFMILVLAVASLLPALRVVRLRIVEALGHD